MKPDLFWIPGPWRGRLAVATRPRGGDWLEDEAIGWRRAGIDVIVSLLEEDEAAQLDLVVNRSPRFQRLNLLEAKAMAEVIEKLKPHLVYVDASDTRPERFKNNILEHLSFRPKLVSEHHADEKYPSVSAASILAKVRRDSRIEEIRKDYGDIGSGYATDPKTVRFLSEYYLANRDFPPIVRRSWKTLRNIVREISQTKLC